MKADSLTEMLSASMRGKRVEPAQRLVGGKFGWAIHRYPIKDGISLGDVMAKSLMTNNALFKRLTGRS